MQTLPYQWRSTSKAVKPLKIRLIAQLEIAFVRIEVKKTMLNFRVKVAAWT